MSMTAEETAAYNSAIERAATAEKRLAELQAVADAQTAKDINLLNITLEPVAGKTGDVVKIKGKGFGKEQGTSLLVFEGRSMQATTWSDTEITVPVPGAVKTGQVQVAVGNKRGSALFTVL